MSHFDIEIAAQGLFCPEPVMMLHSKLNDADSGQIIKLCATDPSTDRDVTRLCQFLGHQLLEKQTLDSEFVFYIQKK